MSSEAVMSFGGVEFANAGRSFALNQTLGLHVVRKPQYANAVGQSYSDVTQAPWYNPRIPASAEFVGYHPLRADGLDDSSREAKVTEYTTAGGNVGRGRNATQAIVFSGYLLASTERGVEFGKAWLSRLLSAKSDASISVGARLEYRRLRDQSSELVHRRDVSLSRAITVVSKRHNSCAHMWKITFTMTAADPFEYGQRVPQVQNLGGANTATGPLVDVAGVQALVQAECPVYTARPFYDPFNSPVVNAPTVPNFLPDGWNLKLGMTFNRYWARIKPSAAAGALNVVPYVHLHGTADTRMVRVSVWPSTSTVANQCDPLWSTVVTYAPANFPMFIDGEAQASYVFDGLGTNVRRADSLVYSPDAYPVSWESFSDPLGYLVTVDLFAKTTDDVGGYTGAGFQGDGLMRVDIDFISKSD